MELLTLKHNVIIFVDYFIINLYKLYLYKIINNKKEGYNVSGWVVWSYIVLLLMFSIPIIICIYYTLTSKTNDEVITCTFLDLSKSIRYKEQKINNSVYIVPDSSYYVKLCLNGENYKLSISNADYMRLNNSRVVGTSINIIKTTVVRKSLFTKETISTCEYRLENLEIL